MLDGDRMDVRLRSGVRERVRVLGIDAPELARRECHAAQAIAATRRLALGKLVRLAGDRSQAARDQKRRLVAYVRLPDGNDLGRSLLRGGFATVVTGSSFVRRRSLPLGGVRRALRADRPVELRRRLDSRIGSSCPARTTGLLVGHDDGRHGHRRDGGRDDDDDGPSGLPHVLSRHVRATHHSLTNANRARRLLTPSSWRVARLRPCAEASAAAAHRRAPARRGRRRGAPGPALVAARRGRRRARRSTARGRPARPHARRDRRSPAQPEHADEPLLPAHARVAAGACSRSGSRRRCPARA